jgi:hypothetical protein
MGRVQLGTSQEIFWQDELEKSKKECQNNSSSNNPTILKQYLRKFSERSEPKELVKWFLVKAMVDPREGGNYSFDNLLGTHWVGKVMRFDNNRQISYSWIANTTASFEVAQEGVGDFAEATSHRLRGSRTLCKNLARVGILSHQHEISSGTRN